MSDFDEKLDEYERHHHYHVDDDDRDSGDDGDYNEVNVQAARLHKTGSGGGLGISLEGTVDVEEGVEVTFCHAHDFYSDDDDYDDDDDDDDIFSSQIRPHHYIRSILPRGPVGVANVFWNGDQLLEVVVNHEDYNDDDDDDSQDHVMVMTSISCSRWSSTKMKQLSLTIW